MPSDGSLPTAGDPSEGASTAQRLHPASPLIELGSRTLQFVPLVVLALLRDGFALIALGLLVLGVAGSFVAWWRRTWTLDGRTLRLDEGVLGRRQRVVPLDRVQQVHLRRGPLHRLAGVAAVRIETAGGGGGSEIELDAIGLERAQWLQAALRAPGVHSAGEDTQVEQVLVRLSPAEIVLAGLTSIRALAALAVLGPALQLAGDLLPVERLVRQLDPEALVRVGASTALAGGALALVVWVLLAAGLGLLTDYGFTMSLRGDDLVVRRGLLDRREAVLPRARVQVVRVEESLVRRWLHRSALRMYSAGSTGKDAYADQVAVPLIRRDRVDEVLAVVLPGATPRPVLARHPPAARRRLLVRALVRSSLLAAALLVVLWFTVGVWPWGLAVLLPVGAAVPLALTAYRALGHAAGDGFVHARQGALRRTTTILPLRGVQSTRVSSSPLQRRSGLASVHLDVAGPISAPVVTDVAGVRAEELAGLARDQSSVTDDPPAHGDGSDVPVSAHRPHPSADQRPGTAATWETQRAT